MPAPRAKDVLSSVVTPLGLAVAAVGGTTFGLTGVWWLLPATAAAMAAVAVAQYRDIRDLEGELRPHYAERQRVLAGLMDRIERALAEASPTLRLALPDVSHQLKQMRTKIGGLVRQQAHLDELRSAADLEEVRDDLHRLEAALLQASTESARSSLRSAIGSRQAELAARESLHANSLRIKAELDEVQAALENSVSRIVSFERAHGGAQADGEGITAQLGDVMVTIDALEQALSELRPRRIPRERQS